jgi:hypothetical protein
MATKYILTRACDTHRHETCVREVRASNPWRRRLMAGYSVYTCACPCHSEDVNAPNFGRTA